MPTIKAVLFDLDGTLVDTAPDFVHVLNALRAAHQLPALAYDTIRRQVSNGARALTTLGFGGESDNPKFNQHLEELLDCYEQHLSASSHLFSGLDETLQSLEQNNIPWGVVTNKPSRFTEPLMRGLNLADRCAVTICPDHVKQRKPHPEPILLACHQLHVNPEQTVYVGDHLRDIEAGNRAGNYTVAVGWGYINDNDDPAQWQADLVTQTTADFHHWLTANLIQ